ncbi:hypothetical protein INS49_004773 [Diaporthe citri]|uniref:uncharacterized protein n=1 Tax=Diaporthe citri TaxID=83186 RepID=UPI001C7E39D2|nr:uncharacterized protein INS49_004773 [Diaporthe citri]KAG6354169.1 hypothetical protein INS49_004773 [Diaporthe citri]
MSDQGAPKGFRFWAVIAALSMTSLLSALENTVVSTPLPTIAALLDIGRDYSWVTNAFFLTRLQRIDYAGNLVIIGATVAILYALTYAGTLMAWSDARVITPLVVGVIGLALLIPIEVWVERHSPADPVVPARLFSSRTGIVVGVNTFINSMLLYWAMFFLPLYFQSVKQFTPAEAGVQMLPVLLVSVPSAIAAALVLSKYGKFKLLHVVGFALMAVGLGLLSIMGAESAKALWVTFQIIAAIGSGMVLNTQLPAFQARVPEADQASATATWAYIRSFGNIWGVSIPAAAFNGRFEALAAGIADDAVRTDLAQGKAFQHATKTFVSGLQQPTLRQAVHVFSESLRLVWWLAAAFAALATLLALVEREIPLRTELETEFGLTSTEHIVVEDPDESGVKHAKSKDTGGSTFAEDGPGIHESGLVSESHW